jgi:hypothetical protein
MRPQQQNRRMRGRNNNNRKGPNPLTRNYESNGPDVKIRGSAQQIAEKYSALARDAMSAGDRVMAENYLQHAEHYNRIIAAAQAQMPIQQFRENRDDFEDDFEDEREEQPAQENAGGSQPALANGEGQPAHAGGDAPQPVIDGTPAEVALNPEAMGNGGGQPRERPNGFHGNGYNGEENGQRRGRRSRRGRGRPDFEQQAGGEGEQAQADERGVDQLPPQLMQPIERKAPPAPAAAAEEGPSAEAAPPQQTEATPFSQD